MMRSLPLPAVANKWNSIRRLLTAIASTMKWKRNEDSQRCSGQMTNVTPFTSIGSVYALQIRDAFHVGMKTERNIYCCISYFIAFYAPPEFLLIRPTTQCENRAHALRAKPHRRAQDANGSYRLCLQTVFCRLRGVYWKIIVGSI